MRKSFSIEEVRQRTDFRVSNGFPAGRCWNKARTAALSEAEAFTETHQESVRFSRTDFRGRVTPDTDCRTVSKGDGSQWDWQMIRSIF